LLIRLDLQDSNHCSSLKSTAIKEKSNPRFNVGPLPPVHRTSIVDLDAEDDDDFSQQKGMYYHFSIRMMSVMQVVLGSLMEEMMNLIKMICKIETI
jgi:hypothetical protein